MPPQRTNTLYYGDNLSVLREHIPDASVDLVYLDPPFNSNRNYNILFKDEHGLEADAQIQAFEDSWHWNDAAARQYHELVSDGPEQVCQLVGALRYLLGTSQMLAYLVMMTARLVELHRVLKPTGSLYLHCDPTASHYLKIILDAIFGSDQFRNEIIWRRTNSHNKTTRQYGPIHDTILFYSKSDALIFHPGTRPYSQAYIQDRFKHEDERGKYQKNYLTGPGVRYGESGSPWHGFDPTTVGRHWAIPASLRVFLPNQGIGMSSLQQLEKLFKQKLIVFPKKETGQPMYKQYVGPGVAYQDIWAYQPNTKGVLYNSEECIDEDVKYLESEDEKLGYETQKPLGLLLRILRTSSNEGDIILDPFCGCGTAVAAAEKLGRRWIGIDITHLAISVMKSRMLEMFPGIAFQIIGEPKDIGAARALANQDRYQFQWWALSLINARPLGGQEGSKQGKKGADRGIDGIIPFLDDATGKPKRAVVQVKSGQVRAGDIRDLRGTIEREQAQIGAFLTLEPPTRDMLAEAASAGFYRSPGWQRDYPRLQVLTIEDLLRGHAAVKMPPAYAPFKQAQAVGEQAEQRKLDW